MKVEDATRELKKTYNILVEDVEEIRSYGKGNPSSFAHRTLLRTYFALVEGMTYQLKCVALACAEAMPGLLTMEEMTLLREETYSLNQKGNVETTANYQNTLPNILFDARCYAKVHGTEFNPDTGHHGWEAMKKFVEIRHGLIHPKSSLDLELDEVKLQNAVEAAEWWKRNMLSLFEACSEADDYWKSVLA